MNKTTSGLKFIIHKKYREFLEIYFPQGSKRRYLLSLLKKSLYIICREGIRGFIRKIKKNVIVRRRVNKEVINEIDLPSSIELFLVPNTLPIKASVIIPTKNAGNEFDYILKKIINQKGISEIEIIIVDSKSDDSTIEIAKKYTNKWFIVSSDEFHNSNIRNFATDKSSGDYLIFMLQDTILGSDDVFYNILFPMITEDVHALTVKKVPRIDADFFSSWLIWQEYNYLNYDRDHIRNNKLYLDFQSLDLRDKIKYSFLDNVCLAINRGIFEKHKFSFPYREDLELGKRLLISGYSLMFIDSSSVIHSYNKDAVYFLKHACVNNYYVKRIFSEMMGKKDFPEICNTIKNLIQYFVFALSSFYDKPFNGNVIYNHFKYFRNLLDAKIQLSDFDSNSFLYKDYQEISSFFNKLELTLSLSPEGYDIEVINRVVNLYEDILVDFKKYFDILGYKSVNEDFLDNFFKLFCFSIGRYLGDELNNIDYFRGNL